MTIILAFGATFLLLTISTAYATEPSEPHNANAMWVEPSTINLNSYIVGQKFNVTVWANMSTLVSPAVGIDTWQISLYFNKNYIKALRTGYTAGTTSELFSGLSTTSVTPIIDNTNGFVSHAETCAPSWKPVPCYGSLIWIEFNVTALTPEPINFNLNITNLDTALVDDQGTKYPPDGSITKYNGIVIPEFSQLLVCLMVLTLVIAILSKTIRKREIYQTKK
jgi:hypothetical protein